jgi:signal transduction histidine kinase
MGKSVRPARHEAVDLKEVCTHMLRVGELDKAALAHELHNELGGLLAAMRMDLAQLQRRIALPDAEAEAQWKRIDSAIVAAVELKRRIIEDLRPTLLDNMGLCTALRWHAEQVCSKAGLRLACELPKEEPELDGDRSIAIFRCVQELLTNVVKHAKASRVKLSLRTGGRLVVMMEDDGIGLPEGALQRDGSHGLKQIAFRMQSIGGEVIMERLMPRGTHTTLSIPL